MPTRKNHRLSADIIKALTRIDDVLVFDTLDSTNNEAKRLIESGASRPAIIAAATQSSGRGRLGRAFYSPKDTGAYFSLIIPDIAPEAAALITPAAAAAAHRAIFSLSGKRTGIKWVNDLYLNGKKVAGILAEAVRGADGALLGVVVGIGINISTEDFPAELDTVAASLGEKDIDINELISLTAKHLFAFAENIAEREFIDDYKKYSTVLGKDISYTANGEKHEAHAVDIDRDGGLVIVTRGGEKKTLIGGEISVRVI